MLVSVGEVGDFCVRSLDVSRFYSTYVHTCLGRKHETTSLSCPALGNDLSPVEFVSRMAKVDRKRREALKGHVLFIANLPKLMTVSSLRVAQLPPALDTLDPFLQLERSRIDLQDYHHHQASLNFYWSQRIQGISVKSQASRITSCCSSEISLVWRRPWPSLFCRRPC